MPSSPTPRERALACAPVCGSCRGRGVRFKNQRCRTCDGTGKLAVASIEAAIADAVDAEGLHFVRFADSVQACIDRARRQYFGASKL